MTPLFFSRMIQFKINYLLSLFNLKRNMTQLFFSRMIQFKINYLLPLFHKNMGNGYGMEDKIVRVGYNNLMVQFEFKLN